VAGREALRGAHSSRVLALASRQCELSGAVLAKSVSRRNAETSQAKRPLRPGVPRRHRQSATVSRYLGVERWWGVVFFALAACEPEPKGPVQVVQPEGMRFETEPVRREVELYKNAPSAKGRQRMERAFAALDERVRGLEALAQTQSGTERTATERQIADLKHRRDLHWTRAQTALAEVETVQRAEPVAEQVVKAERPRNSQNVRRAERARTSQARQITRSESRGAPVNFFQRLFR